MRVAKLACFFCAMLMFTSLSAASGLVGGEDKNPAPGEAPFSILSRDAPSVDGETWSLSIEMNQEEFDNGTVFEITTQSVPTMECVTPLRSWTSPSMSGFTKFQWKPRTITPTSIGE